MKCKILFFLSAAILLILSCTQKSEFKKINANVINNDVIGIIMPPQSGLVNFVIKDSKGRIIESENNLTEEKLIILSKGDYEFSANNISPRNFSIQYDFKVTSDGRTFNKIDIKDREPPKVAFRSGQNWDIVSPLTENVSYNLTILDMENLDNRISLDKYKAVITGNGQTYNCTFNAKENNRLVSAERRVFTAGTYNVNISVDGDNSRIPSMRFTVQKRPPFELTINNLWKGKPLLFADMQCFLIDRNFTSDFMSESDFRIFETSNRANRKLINGMNEINTDSDGKLTVIVSDGDNLVLFAGTRSGDVYLQSITARESQKIRNIEWQNIIPARTGFSDSLKFTVEISNDSLNAWDTLYDGHFNSYLFYIHSTVNYPNGSAIPSDPRFTAVYSEDIEFNPTPDDKVNVTVQLKDVSKVSRISYLLRIEGSGIVFSMSETINEDIKVSPTIFRY